MARQPSKKLAPPKPPPGRAPAPPKGLLRITKKKVAKRRQKPSTSKAAPTTPATSDPVTALVLRIPDRLLPSGGRAKLQDDITKAFNLAEHAQADNTRRAYKADREQWSAYAKECEIPEFPIPPEHLAAFILHMHEHGSAVATIRRRCASLGGWHREQGVPSPMENPAVRDVIKGLLRVRQAAPTKKRALTGDIVGSAIGHASFSLRDRALLVVGFVTGLRRSELVALRWSDLIEANGEFAVRIARSKTDTQGVGALVAIRRHSDPDLCPVEILKQWRAQWQRTKRSKWADLVFPVSQDTVAAIVKRAAALAGEDPALYGAHSSRAGMITAAGQDPSVPQAMTQKAARHARGDQTLDYLDVHNALSNPAFRAATNAIKKKPRAKKGAR